MKHQLQLFVVTSDHQAKQQGTQMATRIDLGSGNLKGSFGFGKREDYVYDVPDGVRVLYVSLDRND